MNKFGQSISIALIVAVALCSASPARLERVKPSKSKVLARQEVAADIPAQTPYPPAGIRPEIPFNLPTDEKLVAPVNYYLPPLEDKPAKFYSPPAQVYGPPAQVNGPPAQVYGPPAQTYGPPEVSVKDDAEEIAQEEPVQQPEEDQPEEQKPEESQPDEVQSEQSEDVSPSPQPEVEQESDNTSVEPESEQVEPAAVEEDALPQRIVKAKSSVRKPAKLRSAKLQVVPAPRQAVFLGSLYAYNGQLYRL